MADKKTTQLTSLLQVDSNDVFPIVDISAFTTKKIRASNLFASPTAIGSTNPNTGAFTTLELPTGSTINEFSTDTTLAGNSDTAIPTEKAVKTYIDAEIADIVSNQNKIFQGNSRIEVHDTTGTAYAEVVVDGIQVSYWDAQASSQRFGKAPGDGGFSLVTSDSSVYAQNDSGTNLASLSDSVQSLGITGDTIISLNQTTNTISFSANSSEVAQFTDTSQRIGISGDTYITMDQSSNTMDMFLGNTQIVDLSTTSQTIGISGDTRIVIDQSADSITMTSGSQTKLLIESSGLTIYDDLTITNSLFVDGTTFVVHNQEVSISPNLFVINNGESGSGVTSGYSGIEIDRGTEVNYQFLFYEDTDTFRIGKIGSLQAVATREDSPVNNTVPWWNTSISRFDTTGNTSIVIDTTGNIISIISATNTVGVFTSSGLKLFSGVSVNEFSVDGTLGGNSDTAVPTEKAVKTYIDSQIAMTSGNIIIQDNSYVQVVDDGTNAGYVQFVTDNVQVAYSTLTSQRFGKASGGFSLTTTNNSAYFQNDSTNNLLNLEVNTQSIGVSGSTILTLNQSTNLFNFSVAGSTVSTFDTNGLTLASGASINEFSTDGTLSGDSNDAVPTENAVKTYVDTSISNFNQDKITEGDSRIEVHDTTGTAYAEVVINGVQVTYWDSEATSQRFGKSSASGGFSLTTNDSSAYFQDDSANNLLNLEADAQTIGISGDTILTLTQSTDSFDFTVAGSQVAVFNNVSQRVGNSGDTFVLLSQSANTASISVGNTEVIDLATASQSFGVSGDTILSLNQSTDTITLTAAGATVTTFNTNGVTLNSNINVNEYSFNYDVALASNDTYSGDIATMTVDVNSFGQFATLYLESDGNWKTADADTTSDIVCRALAMESGTGSKIVMFRGIVRHDAWDWTPGGNLYLSTTSGGMTQTAPSASGQKVQRIGYALSADVIYFLPDSTILEIA